MKSLSVIILQEDDANDLTDNCRDSIASLTQYAIMSSI